MNSRERILATVGGHQPDRVPVIAPGINLYALHSGRFTCSPKHLNFSFVISCKRLSRIVQQDSDIYYLMDVPRFDVYCIENYRQTLLVDKGDYFQIHRELPTPERELHSRFRKSRTEPRIWVSEQPFINDTKDLKKFLSYVRFIPYSTDWLRASHI